MDSRPFSLVRIPDDLQFEDLHLTMDEDTGMVEFDWGPVRAIMDVNADLPLETEGAIVDLIAAWYAYLRLQGYRHEVAELCLPACEASREFGLDRMLAGSKSLQ